MSNHRNLHAGKEPGSASNSYALAVFEYLEQQGHDPLTIFSSPCIQRICQTQVGGRMPAAQWQAILQRSIQCLNDPAFPLKLAAIIQPRHLGMLGYLLMSCDTLQSAALILQRYEALLDGVNVTEFNLHSDHATITWQPLINDPPPEFIMLAMALWARYGRRLTERPELVFDVRFSFAEPKDPALRAAFHATFGGAVLFDQGVNAMTLPTSYLNLPIAQGDQHVHESLRRAADASLHDLFGEGHRFIERLESLLVDRLEHGEVSLQCVADALQVAPRTVQNRLDRCGLTYRQVLDRVRQRQAELHLRNPNLSLADVTSVLGFTHQSAFQHAFKRWTGASPGHYRRMQMQ